MNGFFFWNCQIYWGSEWPSCTDYHVTTLIAYRLYHHRHHHCLATLATWPPLSAWTTIASIFSFDKMTRKKVTARMCTGGSAKRVMLPHRAINAQDIQMQQSTQPLDLQVSAHHAIEQSWDTMAVTFYSIASCVKMGGWYGSAISPIAGVLYALSAWKFLMGSSTSLTAQV